MHHNGSEYITHRSQDRVRIKAGDLKGQKGVIQAVASEKIEIHLDNGTTISIPPEQITNFSLAARKAWQTMRK